MKVAIVGAGASGLASARHVSAAGVDCEVLEMSSEVGGLWLYTDDVGKDQYGFPVYSPMYKYLIANTPKEVMCFPDFLVEESENSYLPHTDYVKFFKQFTEKFDLRKLIRFNRMVTDIRPLDNKWQIKSIDKPTREEFVGVYDAVMVCNGHHNVPNVPKIPGEERFKGKIFHCQQFRTVEPFKNQKILVIGGGPSGLDVIRHVAKVAEHVVFSYHSKAVANTRFAATNITRKPDVLRINDAEEVEFVDNSRCRVDTIILCTGYRFSYPFLHESCGITVDDNYVRPLYKHMVNIERPTMGFIGIPFYCSNFQLYDIQARVYAKYLAGELTWPTSEEMYKDTEKEMQRRWDKGYLKKHAHILNLEQQSYFDDLAALANIASIAPVNPKMWEDNEVALFADFPNFRNYKYKILNDEEFVKIHM